MADRTKPVVFCFLFLALAGLVGCGSTRHSKFQMAFLPAPHPAVAAPEIAEPPSVSEPRFFTRDTPAIAPPATPIAPLLTRTQDLIERATLRFERGRRYYQAKDTQNARKEFDAALDLMLEASDQPMADRKTLERKLDQMIEAVHRYDLAGLGSGADLDEAAFEKAPLEDILEMTFPVDPKLKSKVREQIQATASQLPLSTNDAVLGYIHYFSGRGHRTMVTGFERAGRYKPMIQRILDEVGVPQELIYLAQAESGFQPRAVSRMRATGMWQFMTGRGREYGLEQTRYVDDRLDPEKATRAAARHLRDLYTQFGDWYLAIAAYNCGPGVVEKAVERTGYADFWELRRRRVLPAETTAYVPIILAMTIMAKNAPEYGLDNINAQTAVEYDTVEMTAPTHLALVADLTDSPVSELMALNPALLKGVAPAGFSLYVPKGSANTLVAALESVPAERRASWRIHKVENGDTLASIGKRYGMAPGSIAAANRLQAEEPMEGDQLVIPAAPVAEKKVATKSRASSRRSVARRGGKSSARVKVASRAKSAVTVKSAAAKKFGTSRASTKNSHRSVANTAANRSRGSARSN